MQSLIIMQVDSWRQMEEQPKITDNHTDTEEETWQYWPNRNGWCAGALYTHLQKHLQK